MCNSNARVLFLTIVVTLLVMIGLYVTNPPADVLTWLIGTLSDVTQLLLILVPALLFISCRVLRWGIRRIQPKPGDRQLLSGQVEMLKQVFEMSRSEILLSMVPTHEPKAKPAKSSARINLGDAAFVLSKEQVRSLRDFVGSPGKKSSSLERDVLIVTGEPGSGKSVLLQELYQTLSFGVEKEFHAFIPVFVFAREIRSEELERALNDKHPMRFFLKSYYSTDWRIRDDDLRGFHKLVDRKWNDHDFLIIIDGLDEIPQRSKYEQIQRNLQKMITKDIESREPRKGIHRYILSCRIDEDIKVFSGASSLSLQGLTERQMDRYMKAQLEQRLGSGDRALVRNLLRSHQLTPSHVFRRNPYFLALLIDYLRDNRVHKSSLNFEFLMEEYLKREAQRKYASSKQQPDLITLSTQEVDCLKENAWPFLYVAAFRSMISPQEGITYGETDIKPMIESILRDVVFDPELEDEVTSEHDNDWNWFRKILRVNTSARLSDSDESNLLRLSHNFLLSREKIPLIGKKLRQDGVCKETILYAAQDLINSGILEGRDWYDGLASEYTRILADFCLDETQTLAGAFLFRSIVAAQLLRVISLHYQSDNSVTYRFRHRRLAEYFAARYCLGHWRAAQKMIQPLPWLGPMLNLVCALQSSPNHAMNWLVDQIGQEPSGSIYEWRDSVEVACEAISFAQVDRDFNDLFVRLMAIILHPLLSIATAKKSNAHDAKKIPDNVVTRIMLHRKLSHLSLLAKTIGREFAIDAKTVNAFYEHTRAIGSEWLSYHFSSCVALEQIVSSKYPWRYKFDAMYRFITSPASLLFSITQRKNDHLQIPRRVVRTTTILGEAICWIVWFGTLILVWLIIDALSDSDAVFIRELSQIVAVLLAFLWVLWRLVVLLRTPSKAVVLSSFPWRLLKWFLIVPIFLGIIFVLGRVHGMTVSVFSFSIRLTYLLVLLTLTLLLLKWFRVQGLRGVVHDMRSIIEALVKGLAITGAGLVFIGLLIAFSLLLNSLFSPRPGPTGKIQPAATITITDKNWDRMERLADSRLAGGVEDNTLGTIEALFIERNANRTVFQINEARKTLGAVLKTAENVEKNRIIEMDAKLAETQMSIIQIRESLQPQNRRLLTRIVMACAIALALITIVWIFKQMARDNKINNDISQAENIKQLVKILLDTSHSEQVRRNVLRKIDGITEFDDSDQQMVEVAADSLYKNFEQTERQIGLDTADLAERMYKRLQYRKATGQVTAE